MAGGGGVCAPCRLSPLWMPLPYLCLSFHWASDLLATCGLWSKEFLKVGSQHSSLLNSLIHLLRHTFEKHVVNLTLSQTLGSALDSVCVCVCTCACTRMHAH